MTLMDKPDLFKSKLKEKFMLWNVKQVADYLCISKSKVYQMASNGDLAYVKFGDCVRFRADEIDIYINENRKIKDGKPESTACFNPNLSFNSQYLV
jgi:excisionase family DNA binding protein